MVDGETVATIKPPRELSESLSSLSHSDKITTKAIKRRQIQASGHSIVLEVKTFLSSCSELDRFLPSADSCCPLSMSAPLLPSSLWVLLPPAALSVCFLRSSVFLPLAI
jgi:hypothetical protein